MTRAERRHINNKHKKRSKNPLFGAAKCGNPKCFICHSDKVCKIPNPRDLKRINDLKETGENKIHIFNP